MKYTCTHRSVTAWPGRISVKMFWQLSNISSDCCQDQEGKVFPLNEELGDERVGDQCETRKVAKCMKSTGKGFLKIIGFLQKRNSRGGWCLTQIVLYFKRIERTTSETIIQ